GGLETGSALAVRARRDPTEHVDDEVGGAGGAACVDAYGQLAVAPGPDQRRVRHVLVRLEVDQRARAGVGALAVRLHPAIAGRIDDRDIDGDGEHVVVGAVVVVVDEGGQPPAADDRHVEGGIGADRGGGLPSARGDVFARITCVE